ncbi:unnamed protein product [Knipowitschia caucasica]|uniref:Sulfotransferase n=1 Tax=Knipowitschia caucasica TaxID=637954 RepID=A0AAV2L9P4_KNICA
MADPNYYSMYKGMYVPKLIYFPEGLKYWEEFTFRPDDVIVVTFPKSGTNWALELVPLVLSGGEHSKEPTWERSFAMGHRTALYMDLDAQPSPRMFVTHFRYDAMPESFYRVKPKVINVMRNPKDVLISTFHYHKITEFHPTPDSLTGLQHKFLEGHIAFGSWFDHVKSWLNAEDKSHVLYLTYEEMAQDLPQVVRRVGEFFEKRPDDEAVEKIADMCCFESMKKNNTRKNLMKKDRTNCSGTPKLPVFDHFTFYRKGITGDWRNHLSEEQAQHFDSVYEEKMKDVDFKFNWD